MADPSRPQRSCTLLPTKLYRGPRAKWGELDSETQLAPRFSAPPLPPLASPTGTGRPPAAVPRLCTDSSGEPAPPIRPLSGRVGGTSLDPTRFPSAGRPRSTPLAHHPPSGGGRSAALAHPAGTVAHGLSCWLGWRLAAPLHPIRSVPVPGRNLKLGRRRRPT